MSFSPLRGMVLAASVMARRRRRVLSWLIVSLLLAAPDAFAGRSRFQSPAEPGAYAVGHSIFEVVDPARGDRTLPVDVWYPVDAENAVGELSFYDFHVLGTGVLSEVSLEDAEPSVTIGFPFVVYSHGFGGVSTEAATLMETLASHGFVAAAPSHVGSNSEGIGDSFAVDRHNRPLDVSLVIDAMLARNRDPLDPLYVRINPSQIGVAGFSYGGWTAAATASGHSEPGLGDVPPDPRLRAVATIARKYEVGYQSPEAELVAIDVPLFMIGSTLDVPADPMTTQPWNLATGRPIYRVEATNAAHQHFSWQCDFAESLITLGLVSETQAAQLFAGRTYGEKFFSVCRSPALSIPEAKRIRDFYVTAFFERHLLHDARYDEFLTPAWATAYEPQVIFQRKDAGQP